MTTDEIGSRSAKHHSDQSAVTTDSPTNKNNKPKKKKRILLKIFLGLVALGFIGLLGGAALFWSYARNAAPLDDVKLNATVSSKLFDTNNNVFEDLGAEKREVIKPTEVPQLLKDAVVSVEDKRFYKHSGVDPIRILGSVFSNLRTGGLQGGSTLTQQLIKLSYFSTQEKDQTLERKAQEAWLAVQLEREKSKEEILTFYINKVYMSNGLYGMETAAQTYFGKTLSELNLPQTALLAGMPQAPNDYDPHTNPELAKERRDVVLYTMRENGKITEEEYEQAKATPIDDGLQPLPQSSNNQRIVDNYITEVIAEVEEKTGKNVYTDGLNIYTNLDMNAQKHLYDIINTDEYVEYPDDDLQVASTVIDVKTGQVRAQIGGRKIPEDVQRGQNLALNTGRDVGSTMKPMAVYGPAIENLNYSTGRILVDKTTTYPDGTPVTNADLQYYGALTMRKAIMYSRNTTAVQTFEEVGKEKSAEFLKNLGIEFQTLLDANAISSNTKQDKTKYGVSSLKLAAAYASFANDGVYNKPYYVSKVVYQDDSEIVYKSESKRAMKDSTAYMMTDMLKDVINGGTAFNAAAPGLIQAGKTGTSNYSEDDLIKMGATQTNIAPDSTFVGYTPHYSISVWTGYREPTTPIPYEYWGIASDVYREMMTFLSEGRFSDDWQMPSSVVRIGSELYVKDAYEVPTSWATSAVETSTTQDSTTSESSSEVPTETSTPKEPDSTPPTTLEPQEPNTSEPVTPPTDSPPTEEPIAPDAQNNGKNPSG